MRNSRITRRTALRGALLVPIAATGFSAAAAPSRGEAALQGDGASLVVYLSRTGNTRVIAQKLRRATSADVFELQAAQPYPEDYEETVERAHQERDAGARPPLTGTVGRMADYETVFLGFPIWGRTAPPLVRTFLAGHDLSGKTLVPFITHGGYGTGSSLNVVADHAPRSRILEPLVMQADQERDTVNRVSGWLRDIESAL